MLSSVGRMSALALLLSAVPSAAVAVCDYCNPTVRLDSVTANCFVDQVDAEIVRIKLEGRGFLLVDLTNCVATRGRGLPDASNASAAPVDTSFVVDEAGLVCLKDQLAVAEKPTLDPSIEFDLSTCS